MKSTFPAFTVEMDGSGRRSRVWMNGEELSGVRDISINQKLGCAAEVTITFVAASVCKPTAEQKQ